MAPPKRDENHKPELQRVSRSLSCLIGTASVVAGGISVFTTENQVGSGALLILGALFLIIAISGRIPSRLQIGDNSMEWQEKAEKIVTESVKESVELASPEKQEDIIEQIDDIAPRRVSSEIKDWFYSRSKFEGIVNEAIQKAVSEIRKTSTKVAITSVYDHAPIGTKSQRWDWSITSDDFFVAIETKKYGQPLGRQVISGILQMAATSERIPDKIIIVTAEGLTSAARALVNQSIAPDFGKPTLAEVTPDKRLSTEEQREYLTRVFFREISNFAD